MISISRSHNDLDFCQMPSIKRAKDGRGLLSASALAPLLLHKL